MTLASEPVWRDSTVPVVAQMLSAVQVGANAMHQLADHVFSQARIRACRTDLRAVETGLDAFGQLGSIEPAQVLRVGLQHLHDTRHLDLLSVARFSQPGIARR